MMKHLGLLGSLTRGWGTAPCSVCFVLRRLRTRFVKSRSTFWAVLALVSRNSQPNSLASCIPSSRVTSRSSCLSALLPTSMNIGFWRLTLNMDCRKTSRRSNVARDAMEYTRMKPWPSLWVSRLEGLPQNIRRPRPTEPTDRVMSRTPLSVMIRRYDKASLNKRKATNPPCPAVSITSTKHIRLSTTSCFRYASSIVGSYV
jgi:hypothetical protein